MVEGIPSNNVMSNVTVETKAGAKPKTDIDYITFSGDLKKAQNDALKWINE